MGTLKTGDLVRARVLGFLPGRKAVLDVQGESLVAWSDLPLVRGEVVTAVVESEGGYTRLRLVDDVDPAADGVLAETLSRSGIAADELDLFIARTANELGLRLDGSLIREVRRYLQATEKDLETGIVPLRRLKPLVLNFAAARSRDLPASPRVLMAVAAIGIEGFETIMSVIVLTIAISVYAHGISATPLSRRYGESIRDSNQVD